MTPEETKQYIEHRLGELGWNVHIGKAGYEKIFRFTEGAADGTDQLCHKLLSLGALQDRREITDDVVSMAMTDLAHVDQRLQRPSKGGRAAAEDSDLTSIEQLTAVLEAKVANGEVETEIRLPERPARARPETGLPRSQPAAAPKILVVDASATTRAAFVKALAPDCQVVQAADGEQAWKVLLEQADIELLVIDLALPNLNGHELIKRVRAAISPPHLIGIPIIVVTGPEGADAKLRVLMAGANDFLLKNVEPAELRARVLARHRLSKTAPRARATDKSARPPAARPAPDAKAKPRAMPERASVPAAKKPAARPAGLYTLTTEQRFPGNASARAPHNSLMKQIYRISSTTTITLSATLLLALALAIIYGGRGESPPDQAAEPSTTVARTNEARAPEPSSAAPLADKTTPASEPPNQESSASTRPVAPAAPPVAGSGTTAPGKDAEAIRKAKAEPLPSVPAAPEPAPTPRPRPDTSSETADSQIVPSPRRVPAPAPADQVAAIPAPARPAPAPERNDEAAAAERQTAVAPPLPAAPAASAAKVSREELATFLRRFMSVYEAGDLDQFITLFADNARTNDRIGRKGIREDYDALFRATDLRRMKLGEISWEVEGGQAYGWGDFEVNVRRSNDQESYDYTGSMTFVLEKVDNRLRIVRLYHGQRRAEAR
jgi:CheY-like chemotaxis protein